MKNRLVCFAAAGLIGMLISCEPVTETKTEYEPAPATSDYLEVEIYQWRDPSDNPGDLYAFPSYRFVMEMHNFDVEGGAWFYGVTEYKELKSKVYASLGFGDVYFEFASLDNVQAWAETNLPEPQQEGGWEKVTARVKEKGYAGLYYKDAGDPRGFTHKIAFVRLH
jgi:hypothetical protein